MIIFYHFGLKIIILYKSILLCMAIKEYIQALFQICNCGVIQLKVAIFKKFRPHEGPLYYRFSDLHKTEPDIAYHVVLSSVDDV